MAARGPRAAGAGAQVALERAFPGPATRDAFLALTRIFRRQKSALPSLCREDEMREYARYSSPTCMILIDLSVTLPDTHLQSRRAVPATGFKINSFLATGGFLWREVIQSPNNNDRGQMVFLLLLLF